MTILQLRLAVEAASKGSISSAADDLKISQPNASLAIKKLEKELGYTIFNRIGSMISTTEQGSLFLEHAQMVLSEEKAMRSLSNEKRISRLRIGVMNYGPMINAFIRFCGENQDTAYGDSSCINVSPEYGITLLRDRILDIVISLQLREMLPMSEKLCRDNRLTMKRLRQIPICVRVRKEHPLVVSGVLDGSTKALQHLSKYPYVQYRNMEQIPKVYTQTISVPYGCSYTISVDERDTRLKILNETDAYSAGCALPQRMLEEYNLISFPTGMEATLVSFIRQGEERLSTIERYFEILKEEIDRF